MFRKYEYVDDNLHAHIHTLRMVVAGLIIVVIVMAIGWYLADRTHRISLPPRLDYGGEFRTGAIHPWEVYSFTGTIWQLINRCQTDCAVDLAQRRREAVAFLSPGFFEWLERDSQRRQRELAGRTRSMVPIGTWRRGLVEEVDADRWRVTLDVEIEETLHGGTVKDTAVRYVILVAWRPDDLEYNPWGLVLEGHAETPRRIGVE